MKVISLQRLLKFSYVLILIFSTSAWAQKYQIGETVFVGFPSNTIKDDAFIVGQVTRLLDNGDIQLFVEDYVKGHDYGAFCQPVAVVEPGKQSEYGDGWEVWQDTRRLDQPNLEYVVSINNVMPYRVGQNSYIERNNIWVVFGRWMSDAPILAVERLKRAQADAGSVGLAGMREAFDLAIAHRYAFYEDGWGRPYWPYETVPHLHSVLDQVESLLQQDQALNTLWRTNERDNKQVEENVRTYFLIVALDKLVKDAFYQLYENLDQADAEDVARLEARLLKLGKKKI